METECLSTDGERYQGCQGTNPRPSLVIRPAQWLGRTSLFQEVSLVFVGGQFQGQANVETGLGVLNGLAQDFFALLDPVLDGVAVQEQDGRGFGDFAVITEVAP